MTRCIVGEKKVALYRNKTGLPVVAALVRGGEDHKIDLCLEDGAVVYWFKDGTMKKSNIRHDFIPPKVARTGHDYSVPERVSRA